MYRIDKVSRNEFPDLLQVWESSVRETHHFLNDGDIDFFKNFIQEKDVFGQVNLACARDQSGRIGGFLGTAGENLEMLFIDAAERGKGIGKMLLTHAVIELKITKVDVNEQNEQAVGFYTHFGFETISRSEVDGLGKPYPILHMELPAARKM